MYHRLDDDSQCFLIGCVKQRNRCYTTVCNEDLALHVALPTYMHDALGNRPTQLRTKIKLLVN